MIGFHSPVEVVQNHIRHAIRKTGLTVSQMIMAGVMAGAFIALGCMASATAAHDIANVGFARIIGGIVFPIGLMMVVFVGGELFTGNCLIFMAVLDGKVKWKSFLQNLVVVYFSNLLGALLIDTLVYFCGTLNFSGGGLGAYLINVAVSKVSLTPLQGICSAILCNILVCIALLMAASAKDVAGKVWAVFFPIFAFFVSGFEHCVANMFFVPIGMMAASNPVYVAKAQEIYGLSMEQIASVNFAGCFHNLLFVTIGNIIGGAICVGSICYELHENSENRKSK